MRKGLIGALATSAALAFSIGFAPTAAAEESPPGCPKGYFCAYSGVNQTGTLKLLTWGNWSGALSGVRSVFNNGNPCDGCDHVELLYYDGSGNYLRCLHYNPGPGTYKMSWNYHSVTIKGVTWRGEC